MVSTHLRCALIPDGHHTQLLLKKAHILFRGSMLWIMTVLAVQIKMDYLTVHKEIWEEGIRYYDSALPLVLLERHLL